MEKYPRASQMLFQPQMRTKLYEEGEQSLTEEYRFYGEKQEMTFLSYICHIK